MKKALVTGSAGFVGSALVKALKDRGVDTVGYDLRDGKSIFDEQLLSQSLVGVDTVFHLAALVSVPESIKNPGEAYRINVEGTRAVLEAAKRVGVTRFVYSSSAAVYGNVSELPLTEDGPTAPLSPYGDSKLKGEELVRGAVGIETVALRYMNILGPGQDASSPYAAVVPIFLQKIKVGEPLLIQGDGTQTRDFVYLDDVVSANIAAATAAGVRGMVFNIGSGVEVSLNEIVAVLEECLGRKLEVVYGPAREGDIYRSVADISQAKTHLGWAPTVSLQEAFERILAA